MRPGRRSILYYSSIAYGSAVVAGALLIEGARAVVLAAPLLALAFLPQLQSRGLGEALVYAAAVYMAASIGAASMPLLLVAPLLYAPRRLSASRDRLPLGPSTRRFLVYSLVLLLTGVAYPLLGLYVLASIAASLLYSLASYMRLRGVEASLLHAPLRVALGSRGSIAIRVSSRAPVWLEAYTSRGFNASKAIEPGAAVVEIALPSDTLGHHRLQVELYAVDPWGIAQRMVARLGVEYRVVPMLHVVARRTRRWLSGGEAAGEGLGLEIGFYRARGPGYAGGLTRLGLHGMVEAGRGGAMGPGDGLIEALAAGLAVEASQAARRSRIGEYMAARLYVPGDDPRSIHWKKSLKLRELVVKEYGEPAGSSRGGAGRGGSQLVIVADLAASSPRDLDRVLRALIERLAGAARDEPELETILLLHQGGRYLVVKGASSEALDAVGRVAEDYLPIAYYDYESIAEPVDAAVAAKTLIEQYKAPLTLWLIQDYAKAVVKLLESWGVRRGAELVIIHARASAARNSLLEYMARGLFSASVSRLDVSTP